MSISSVKLDYLRFIAIVTMVVDHLGVYVFPNVLGFRLIGRLSYPLFLFCLGNVSHSTKRFKKIFIFGVVISFIDKGLLLGLSLMMLIQDRLNFYSALILCSLGFILYYLLPSYVTGYQFSGIFIVLYGSLYSFIFYALYQSLYWGFGFLIVYLIFGGLLPFWLTRQSFNFKFGFSVIKYISRRSLYIYISQCLIFYLITLFY